MIVRERPSGFKLFWILRGSVLPRILPSLVTTTLIAIVVTWSHGDLFKLKITLTTLPFTLLGLPISIFLGFRNSAAYDRYWEGRKLWGELVIRVRNLSRQCQTLITGTAPGVGGDGLEDVRVRMVYRAIAFAHVLRQLLRDEAKVEEVQGLVTAAEYQALGSHSHWPGFLMMQMGTDLAQCVREGRIESCLAANIDSTLSGMCAAAASCERIKSTPIPFSYTLLLHRTAYLYCFLLPFGLVDALGFMTPFVVTIVAYTFFGLDALGDEIEEPFGNDPNDLPLAAICRAIEIDLRASLGERDLPKPLSPTQFCLM
ncbi:MAG: bestrophin [Burkholderiales bacterium]|nr:bestrophin [Burkholderiales bacterium]